jgi:SRSO17 transposase
MGYVLAVRANHALTVGSGQNLTAAAAVKLIPRGAWQRMRTGHGTKGSRHYDWAMLEVTSDDAPSDHHGRRDAGHSLLLIRRHRYTGTCSFYRCWTPRPVPLTRLIAIAVTGWRIEEDHQLAKQVTSLDSGQVIRWRSWHRWGTLCLLACIYLAVTVATHHDSPVGPEIGLILVTIPELVRLLRDSVIPSPCRDQTHRQHWSQWRRRHQYRARQAHRRWNAYADTTP